MCPDKTRLIKLDQIKAATANMNSTKDDDISVSKVEHVNSGRATLTLIRGPQAGEVFLLVPLPVIIGRDAQADLFLNNVTVSRRNSEVYKVKQAYHIKDLNSLNGTRVNGAVVTDVQLKEGDVVQIGSFVMRFSNK